MDEDHPQAPINPYGATKLIGERMLQDYERAYGLRYCAFRYFCAAGASADGVIGEAHNPETHLIPVMIRSLMSGEPFSVFGTDYDTRDGSCVRDFIHVEDLAEAHILGLESIMRHDRSDVFNLGSGVGFTVLEMIRALEEVSGQKVPHRLAPRREGDPAVLVASNQKAMKLLEWRPVRSDIRTILSDALRWENNRRY
jgi:UDP-glucose 4-epimerase